MWFLSCGFRSQKKSKKSSETLTFKRPEGMHREVYALLYSDKKQVLESQVPQALVPDLSACPDPSAWFSLPVLSPAALPSQGSCLLIRMQDLLRLLILGRDFLAVG